ncbi:MAG: PDZ domain-containing protein [Candidatus Methylomirabilia bacterium]
MKRSWSLLIVIPVALIHGCAVSPPAVPTPKTIYQSWNQKLDPFYLRTVDDVSLILGGPPSKCDTFEPSRIDRYPSLGISLGSNRNPQSTYINNVRPNSLAFLAKVVVGEDIQHVNNFKVQTSEDVKNVLALDAYETPVSIRTKKNSYNIVFPPVKEARQCYWDISGGQVGSATGGSFVLPNAASPRNATSVYERFFRSVCRFYDGILIACICNWQE